MRYLYYLECDIHNHSAAARDVDTLARERERERVRGRGASERTHSRQWLRVSRYVAKPHNYDVSSRAAPASCVAL